MPSTLPRNEVRRESAFTSARTRSLSLTFSLTLFLCHFSRLCCNASYFTCLRERRKKLERAHLWHVTFPFARYVTLSSYVIALRRGNLYFDIRIFELSSASVCFRTRLCLAASFLCFLVSLTKFLCFVYANYVCVLRLSFSGYRTWIWRWLSEFLRHFSAHNLGDSLFLVASCRQQTVEGLGIREDVSRSIHIFKL